MSRVVFVHPDLGIGGAERLVVDAALALKEKGYSVSFITSHHDKKHCFPETRDGSLEVEVAGDWLPRSICGKFFAVCAYLRMIYISIFLVWFSKIQYDIAFVDQISACIPILNLKQKTKVIFYCHYPDQLLTKKDGTMKKMYRYFVDAIEEYTTKLADVILVNSNFTKKVFKDTFKSISLSPSVLYPSINFLQFEEAESVDKHNFHGKIIFLSLNRYERKKNISLSLYAMADLKHSVSSEKFADTHLVIAGGYDERVSENIGHYNELKSLCKKLELENNVTFYKSIPNEMKVNLLKEATCLLYTPKDEHFGIVPIEAMYVGTPVLAVNSGGPLETIEEGVTGFLRPQTPEDFSGVMSKFLCGKLSKKEMSAQCKKHVVNNFSFDKFASDLDEVVKTA